MLFLLKVVWRRDDFGKCLSISCKNFQHVLEQSEIFYLEKFRHDFMIFSNIGNTGTKIFFKAKMGILNGFSLKKIVVATERFFLPEMQRQQHVAIGYHILRYSFFKFWHCKCTANMHTYDIHIPKI